MGDLIGVFGGTFDPPHIGHCVLAEHAMHHLRLDRVYWIPAGQPPHKPDRPISPVKHRLNMVRLITDQHDGFETSEVDMDRPGPHYSKDTLDALRSLQPEARWVYLMGADSLRDLPTWKDPAIFLARSAAIGVMKRPDVEIPFEDLENEIPSLSGKVRFFPAPLIEISGRGIRERIRDGLPYRYMLTPDVHTYILEHNLYR